MNRFFGFLAGSLCGAVVGATTALLLTPASGDDLKNEAAARWEEALAEARQAMEMTRRDLEAQFEHMKQAG